MKILILFILLNLMACGNTYYDQRVNEFRSSPVYNGVSVMGDSNTEGCDNLCPECFKGNRANRGISGATSYDMSRLMRDIIVKEQPYRIDLMVGTNDINGGTDTYEYTRMLMRSLRIALNGIKGVNIYISTILPMNMAPEAKIRYMNLLIERVVNLHPGQVFFIDRYSEFLDSDGKINLDLFTGDEVHLNEKGCKIMFGGYENDRSA
jgi:lysophospholipase L1-like esterase